MKKAKLIATLTVIMLLSACEVFLGPDPDDNPREIFNSVWRDFNKTYALFEHKGIDWDDVYRQFSPQISQDMSGRELFDVIADMLSVLNDSHVRLASYFAYFNSGGWLDDSNRDPFSLDVVRTYLNGGGRNAVEGIFLYGTFSSNPDIGYIHISAFSHGTTGVAGQDWTRAINGIVQYLADTNSLVLDLRGNTGGLPANVNYISARFAAERRNYAQLRTKNGPGRNDFSSPVTYTINPAGVRYTKPIVLLTNRQTISADEWFTLALRSQDHVTHVGGPGGGAFSLSLERRLVNGWLYWVSVQVVTDMNGICYEETGIPPDHAVANTETEIAAGQDRQLEYSKALLSAGGP